MIQIEKKLKIYYVIGLQISLVGARLLSIVVNILITDKQKDNELYNMHKELKKYI